MDNYRGPIPKDTSATTRHTRFVDSETRRPSELLWCHDVERFALGNPEGMVVIVVPVTSSSGDREGAILGGEDDTDGSCSR